MKSYGISCNQQNKDKPDEDDIKKISSLTIYARQ